MTTSIDICEEHIMDCDERWGWFIDIETNDKTVIITYTTDINDTMDTIDTNDTNDKDKQNKNNCNISSIVGTLFVMALMYMLC